VTSDDEETRVGDAGQPPPRSLGAYRLLATLGSGGMGRVWRAEGPAGVVAVKVVHPHLLATDGFRERFEREARLGLAIRHVNVIRTIECFDAEVDGARAPALVLEYVEGRSLVDLQRERGHVPEDLCRHLAQEIASGLAAIHAAGIVHRDLKPGNVLVTPDHRVKVMDLGLARRGSGEDRVSATGMFVGTAAYAPPEQFQGKEELDPRSDLWSLGILKICPKKRHARKCHACPLFEVCLL
jgi:serine/threonine protein kinase